MSGKYNKYQDILNYTPISINDVFSNQELIFYTFLGYFPNTNVRLLSPFRKDKSPNCRFEYFDGLWWFVDNATYKNKLYFNCIEVVMYLYDITFKEAIRKIASSVKLKNIDNYNLNFSKVEKEEKVNKDIQIKILKKSWNNDNYFTNRLNIDKDYLDLQPYYNIKDYWCSTKKDSRLIKNRFGKPKNSIAYYFERDNSIKLYFPDSDLKWYSNVKDTNLFGYHRMGEYLMNLENNRTIFITSSGKDEMCLNYFLEANSLGLQSETVYKLPNYILRNLKWFNIIYIWMDSDPAGYKCSEELYNFLKVIFPNKTVIKVIHPKSKGKDIAEIIENNHNLLKIFNNIINE